jgi:hypothetical protein
MHFQTNVILTQDDAVWLDEQTLAFRKNNRKPLSRSALLRAILQGARMVDLDLSRCRSEKEIAEGMAGLLCRGSIHLQDELRNRRQNDALNR